MKGVIFKKITGFIKDLNAKNFEDLLKIYLVIAYLLHTIGELCTSPTVMALITKLAPLKYASLLMGTYFACTGFGNKLAASLGKWAQGDIATPTIPHGNEGRPLNS